MMHDSCLDVEVEVKAEGKILVVEDEKGISAFLSVILAGDGYQAVFASTGTEALSMAASHSPDLILLDLSLPDMDGKEILSRIREWSDVPILVVSARQDEKEKVACLDAGANDYVTKPFGNSELLARIRASLRLRERLKNQSLSRENAFSTGGLTIKYARREVTVDGTRIHLTPIEYKLIVLLSQYAGAVLTHDFILREIWGPFASDSQLLRVNMANIRRKIETNPADPCYIQTEVGVGYRMMDAQSQQMG